MMTKRSSQNLGAVVISHSHDNMTPVAWTNYADRVRPTHWYDKEMTA